MNVHFISIGGAVMHNFALALQAQGHKVTGSDDQIFEPSKSRLKANGLLPEKMGWHPDQISRNIDLVILGMHAKRDNPELKRAQELNIPLYSFPEFTFENSKDKKRVVVAGSHGKTTTTGMLMHVFKTLGKKNDYIVGSQLEGYKRMVQFSDAQTILIEGDEYLSSPLDMNPKFLHYKPQVSMITGIAWDHINVFPTFENYVFQFERFLDSLPENATCCYNEGDETLKNLCLSYTKDKKGVKLIPYHLLDYKTVPNGITILHNSRSYHMPWFGRHNVSNCAGAMMTAEQLGIDNHDFLTAMQSFNGTSRRMEIIHEKKDEHYSVIRDFAHSPSKVKATVSAIKEQYPSRKFIAILELHTFSSLQEDFLPQYNGSLELADESIVFVDEQVFEMKGMPQLTDEVIRKSFGSDIKVLRTKDKLHEVLKSISKNQEVLLLMSSGSFKGLDIEVVQ